MKNPIQGFIIFFSFLFSINFHAQTCFGPASNYTVGNYPYSMTKADFNGDGNMDIATANCYSQDVSILLGNGMGSFQPAVSIAAPQGSNYSIISGDFNNDGKQDLAAANSVGMAGVAIFIGNGMGGFSSQIKFPVGDGPASITKGDFNGDGNLDLATANCFDYDISIILGNGLGGFSAATNFPNGTAPYFIKSADFNGDGKADLVTSNFFDNSISVFLGDGLGGFSTPVQQTVGIWPFGIVTADLNNDGKIDIATAHDGDSVSVLLGNRLGGFAIVSKFPGGANRSLTVDDFNNDGISDLAVASGTTVSVLNGNGQGSFSPPHNFSVAASLYSSVSADFDNDGRVDIAASGYINYPLGHLHVLLNNSFSFLTAATSSVVCVGNPIALTAFGPNTYTWSNGIINAMPFTPSATAIYSVTGTNPEGCVNTQTIAVAVNSTPTITVGSSSSLICTGESATLNAAGANYYVWSPVGNTSFMIVSPTVTSTYIVMGINIGCPSDTKTITLNVDACIGMEEFTILGPDQIFPNPTNGKITVTFKNELNDGAIRITDATGRVITQQTNLSGNNLILDLSEFANGFYFLEITDSKNIVRTKVLKN